MTNEAKPVGLRVVGAGLLIVLGIVGGVLLGRSRSSDAERDVVERVAEVEHEQWMAWSKAVAAEVSPERQARWKEHWVPYADLPEDVKELDRRWARKALAAARRR
jgi:hypothetical protein